MINYFIRRILLMIPTFIGITFLCFTVMRFVPGGPVEQAIARFQQMQSQGGEGGGAGVGADTGQDSSGQMSKEMMDKLKAIYGFDKPFYQAYAIWLWKVCHFDLGESDTYARPVWSVIKERFPVSITFGLIGFLLSYSICVPLGVWKAVKHGSPFDWGSSIIVFIGYSIPGWAAGIVLLVLFGGGSFWNVFPLGGMVSSNFTELSTFAKFKDLVWHLTLPVLCYMVGSFASLTILMKNSLMENLGQDYVRTAFAKGLSENAVIFGHALRNSLIPIATGLGHIFSLILAGSYLIEKVFNIQGFGMLGYKSIVARDYPVILGTLVIASVLKLVGNLISDFLYCVIDPRIRLS